MNIREKFQDYIHQLQDKICEGLENEDGKVKFEEDLWQRDGGGGGRTRVISNGEVFEKGGVNISIVHGELPELMQKNFKVNNNKFFACGLSLVIHPKSPMVPTVHANYRYFELYDSDGNIADAWFGGGKDLTPNYLFEEDAAHFHKVCKEVCDRHHPDFYTHYKKECDTYFTNTHRGEMRGIGGIFFDYLRKDQPLDMEQWYNFVTDAGNHFLDAYIPIVSKRKNLPYEDKHVEWQEYRRGRYVEFNLLHDRGTLFGLKTNGRTESILMSLPPRARWGYNHHPIQGSEEAKMVAALQPRDWANH